MPIAHPIERPLEANERRSATPSASPSPTATSSATSSKPSRDAGLTFDGYGDGQTVRRPASGIDGLDVKVIRPHDMPQLVATGEFDLAITGRDCLLEHRYAFPSSPADRARRPPARPVQPLRRRQRRPPRDDHRRGAPALARRGQAAPPRRRRVPRHRRPLRPQPPLLALSGHPHRGRLRRLRPRRRRPPHRRHRDRQDHRRKPPQGHRPPLPLDDVRNRPPHPDLNARHHRVYEQILSALQPSCRTAARNHLTNPRTSFTGQPRPCRGHPAPRY